VPWKPSWLREVSAAPGVILPHQPIPPLLPLTSPLLGLHAAKACRITLDPAFEGDTSKSSLAYVIQNSFRHAVQASALIVLTSKVCLVLIIINGRSQYRLDVWFECKREKAEKG
jgi:hypothetical protein